MARVQTVNEGDVALARKAYEAQCDWVTEFNKPRLQFIEWEAKMLVAMSELKVFFGCVNKYLNHIKLSGRKVDAQKQVRTRTSPC